ncbi:YigZ family protein [Campylobacter sp. Cr9]|uniref:YigZ family protein n=1 Tax=Campylobacter sp. Cr9 TaxID=2735728 RepID=UPI003014EE74|nr:YigZ family protein [Campylobacter sp. Cr9]
MKVLKSPCFDSFEVKGSKFLCFFEPLSINENVRTRQEELRAEHFKCVHVVYASRVLNEFGQIVENQSDDGEPKGSSGAPALNVLRGANIVNAVCYVVRYFGGTLLGVGGLVRAYSNAVNLGINKAYEFDLLIDYVKKESFFLDLEYSQVNKISYILDKLEIKYNKEFGINVRFILELSESEKENLEKELSESMLKLKEYKG